jgi:hypothetical protein
MRDFLKIYHEFEGTEYKAYVFPTLTDSGTAKILTGNELLQAACDEFYRRTGVIAMTRDLWCDGETEIFSRHDKSLTKCPLPTVIAKANDNFPTFEEN